jgi:hypothetical protein
MLKPFAVSYKVTSNHVTLSIRIDSAFTRSFVSHLPQLDRDDLARTYQLYNFTQCLVTTLPSRFDVSCIIPESILLFS